jgi:hypothetical protein
MPNVAAAPPGDLDLWLAFAAGPAVWADDDEPGGLELLGVLLVAVVGGLALLPVVARAPRLEEQSSVAAAVIGVILGAALLSVVPMSLALGHPAPGLLTHRPYVAALLRVVGAVGFVVCWLTLSPVWAFPLLSLLGVVGGGEAAVTARSLGVRVDPRGWLARALKSWMHLGFLTGVALVIVNDPTLETAYVAVGVMVVSYASLGVAVATAAWVDRTLAAIDRRADLRLEQYAEGEDRRRSHWLHDDVLGMLTGVQMKLEREQWDSATTAAELRWLDHQLRLRQSDEILRSGAATVSEVIQPYLRYAQNMKVTVAEVPAWEVGSLRLDEADARRVQRVFGVAVPNALAAGATWLAFRVGAIGTDTLVVEVEDDAGGFDTSTLVPGRGLAVLERELQPDTLRLRRTASGTLVHAELQVGER